MFRERNRAICAAYKTGRTGPDIAAEFGLTHARVSQIIHMGGLSRQDGGMHVRAIKKQPPYETQEEKRLRRFWAKIDRRGDNECWPWTGAKTQKGYGRVGPQAHNGEAYAHRVMWKLANPDKHIQRNTSRGPGPMVIRHSCDHPWCVNPRHLLCGTQKENVKDREDRLSPERKKERRLAQAASNSIIWTSAKRKEHGAKIRAGHARRRQRGV